MSAQGSNRKEKKQKLLDYINTKIANMERIMNY